MWCLRSPLYPFAALRFAAQRRRAAAAIRARPSGDRFRLFFFRVTAAGDTLPSFRGRPGLRRAVRSVPLRLGTNNARAARRLAISPSSISKISLRAIQAL